jgi:RNA polymerase sigma-70 factor (ECF subfamily)
MTEELGSSCVEPDRDTVNALTISGSRGSTAAEQKPRGIATSEVEPALLAAARRGDHGAFVDVLRFYDRRLRHVAWQMVRDRQAMDDILQEVALRAFRGLPAFRGDAGAGTWLCRIAYTTCLDHLRRQAHQPPVTADDQVRERPEADCTEEFLARITLDEAFAALSAEQRLAVLLVDREGLDYRSAAQILGVVPGTLASRLFNARTTLRAAILTDGEEAHR